MGEPEGARVAFQAGEMREHVLCRRAPEENREKPVFVRSEEVDLVGLGLAGIVTGHGVEVGPQHRARDARQGLDRQHPFGRNFLPVGDSGLRNSQPASQRTDSASRPDRLVETTLSHFHPVARTASNAPRSLCLGP